MSALDRARPLGKLSEEDIAYYRSLAAGSDEVVIAKVEVCDFTERYVQDGRVYCYFGTKKSWITWCRENRMPLVN